MCNEVVDLTKCRVTTCLETWKCLDNDKIDFSESEGNNENVREFHVVWKMVTLRVMH